MRKTKPKPPFRTEAELCAAFIEWMKRYSEWTPYPETAAWDILLAHSDGTQVGIQAKLKFNMTVLEQAIEPGQWGVSDVGPDYRAILVPERPNQNICDTLGLTAIWFDERWDGRREFRPGLTERNWLDHWHYCNPKKRHELPRYVPDVIAGAAAPVALTKWKIGALQISAIIELRGYVVREDFRVAGIDHRRWTNYWLQAVPDKPGCYCWKDGVDQGFAKQHPVIYPQVLSEMRERGFGPVEVSV